MIPLVIYYYDEAICNLAIQSFDCTILCNPPIRSIPTQSSTEAGGEFSEGQCQARLIPSWTARISSNFLQHRPRRHVSRTRSCPFLSTMAPSRAPSAALLRSLRALTCEATPAVRSYSSTRALQQETQAAAPTPETVATYKEEWELTKAGTPPIGSRRRRLALQQTSNIPFDSLPYQCFQEARQILIQDRAEKIKQIETERARIQRVRDTDPSTLAGGEAQKTKRLQSMEAHLEKLKIYADINDPNVKRRFEDGKGQHILFLYVHHINCYRRPQQAHIPIPGRAQVARIPPQSPGPAY